MDVDELEREYVQHFPYWENLRAHVENELPVLVGDTEIRNVYTRVKSWEALKSKHARRVASGKTGWSVSQDMLGIRLIVDGTRQVAQLKEAIEQAYLVAEIYEPQAHLFQGEPRYGELYIVVAVPKPTSGQDWGPITDRLLEFQIRTTFAQAWWEARHIAPGSTTVELMEMVLSPAKGVQMRFGPVIEELERLIEMPGVHETLHVQPHLNKHSWLLTPNPDSILAEVPIGIGTEYKMDFMIREPSGEYTLVEVENPQHELFSITGRFRATVNHAVQQVEDWQEWIEDNLPSMQKRYPTMSSPKGVVIIGRSKKLSPKDHRRLARRNINMTGRLRIMTYDELLANARAYVRTLANALA